MITRREEQKVEIREKMRGGSGLVKLTALSSRLHPHMRLFSELSLQPGESIGYHTHEGETEFYYFLSGSGRVSDDGEFFAVGAGDSMCTPSGHGHSVENVGDGELRFVAVIATD
ncbi:MAG: cupin domain-containing protein [Clostridiales bacterium]|nr:cupin domain-containing protein [Clostridiales bacterium]